MRQLWLEMVSKVWGSRRRKSIRRCSSIFTLKKAWRSSICQNSLRRWQIAATSTASGTRLGDLQLQIGSIGGLSEMHKSYREAKWEESGPESIYNRRITRRRRGRRNSGEEIHPPQGQPGGVERWRLWTAMGQLEVGYIHRGGSQATGAEGDSTAVSRCNAHTMYVH
jgi:hypothetical protein